MKTPEQQMADVEALLADVHRAVERGSLSDAETELFLMMQAQLAMASLTLAMALLQTSAGGQPLEQIDATILGG